MKCGDLPREINKFATSNNNQAKLLERSLTSPPRLVLPNSFASDCILSDVHAANFFYTLFFCLAFLLRPSSWNRCAPAALAISL